jgi:hypothetical protein
MEDQTRLGRTQTGRRVAAVTGRLATVRGAVAAVLLGVAASACSGPEWHGGSAVRPDERSPQSYCMVERDTEPKARVINYVDPELCGRYARMRSNTAVRVPPLVAAQQRVAATQRELAAAQERARALGARP